MKIHSAVDLITNSSTSIYSTATVNTVKAFKSFLDAALKQAGSDKTANDIYDISLGISDETLEMAFDVLMDDEEPTFLEHLEGEDLDAMKQYIAADYEGQKPLQDRAYKILGDLLTSGKVAVPGEDGDDRSMYDICIRDIHGNDVEEKILSSLDSWSTYN